MIPMRPGVCLLFFSESLRPLSTRPTLMVEGAWTPESAGAPEIPCTCWIVSRNPSAQPRCRFLPKCFWSKQQRADQYSDALCVPCKPTWYPPEGEWGTQIHPQAGMPGFRERSHCEPTMHGAHSLSLKTQFNCRLLFLALTLILRLKN